MHLYIGKENAKKQLNTPLIHFFHRVMLHDIFIHSEFVCF